MLCCSDNLQDTLGVVSKWRQEGLSIASTSGCFDLFHLGHLRFLERAKTFGDRLIVFLNSDLSVSNLKGPSRPFIQHDARAAILIALPPVDFVYSFDENTPVMPINALQPDVFVKGSDWKDKKIAGSEIIDGYGGRIEFVDHLESWSTTGIIDRILGQA